MKWFMLYILIGFLYARFRAKDIRNKIVDDLSGERNIISETTLGIFLSPLGNILIYSINTLFWIYKLPKYLIKRKKEKKEIGND